MEYREKVLSAGLDITPKIDRDYFFSLYFREPGGVLFEIATDNPGFTVDEPLSSLGSALKLPKQYENYRSQIEQTLPKID
jgi:glyoxalase family protein